MRSAYKIGDRVTIVRSRDKSLIGLDATVMRGLRKLEHIPGPPCYGISTDDGGKFHAPPDALMGPLVPGDHTSHGSWADCIWKPQEISR